MKKIILIVGISLIIGATFYFLALTNPQTKKDCEWLWWYDDDHQYCQYDEFCGMYMYKGLYVFETKEECEKSLTEKNQ